MSAETVGDFDPCLDEPITGNFGGSNAYAEQPAHVRLVCWNIERGLRLPAVADALGGPLRSDVCVLQEVDLHTRRTGFRNIPEELARRLGMNYAFGPEFEELAQGGSPRRPLHGQAVLSRLPMGSERVLRFENQPHDWGPWWKPRLACLQPRRGGRIALVVEIGWANSAITIYNTHLESKTDDSGGALQMEEILRDMRNRYGPQTPVVVAGDLNTAEGARSPVVAGLLAAKFRDVFEGEPHPPGTSVRSAERLDWVFVRNLTFWDARVHRLEITDHFPLTVSIATSETAAWNRRGLR
jgi:endonuclease/exonuclease/phosphatase family metal-dependent hydrolase